MKRDTEIKGNPMLPPVLMGDELRNALFYSPPYEEEYRRLDAGSRLLKLTELYTVFIPSDMSVEIYQRLYMMTSISLKQKDGVDSIKKLNQNHMYPPAGEFCGVIPGASSVSVIGDSGIGKTTCIQKAVRLMGPVLVTEVPFRKIIPVVMVTCPFDSNYKGLLCQILIALDEALGTNFYEKSQKSTMNAQQILGMVCQLCHLHVGVLIIDEIQFIVEHKAGKQLYRMILQLINSSGIGVILVGTNECLEFFSQSPQMARRAAGLQYTNLDYDREFRELAKKLFSLQFTKNKTYLTEGILLWLYEHSGGNAANLMALIHDAQEYAILNGTETLDVASLSAVYNKRMQMLHSFINPGKVKGGHGTTTRTKSNSVFNQENTGTSASKPRIENTSTSATQPRIESTRTHSEPRIKNTRTHSEPCIENTRTPTLADIINIARTTGQDIVEALSKVIAVEVI